MADTKPRDEASKDASRPAEQSTNMAATTATALEAAKEEAKRADIDAAFREDVRKASEKRDKALAKLPSEKRGNIAEVAWNETKGDDDPVYADTAVDHRRKLDTVVQTVRETGNADVVGLEAFEERVKELLAEEKEAEGTPSRVPATAKAQVEKGKE
jgi:hypothetical protein